MEFINEILMSKNYTFIVLVFIAVLVVWFLPALISLFFNPKQFKYILLACIPAGLSFIAWGGVMIWALGGKSISKYAGKVRNENKT